MASTQAAEGGGAAELEAGVLHSHWLGPRPEEEVLRAGLLRADEALAGEDPLSFPRRANGSPLLMRQGFFERLLRGEITLQNCAAADASAAETDVKRLGLHQLLRIRCLHLDFVPSGGQASKASFLSMVDRCTMSLLAERLLSEDAQALSDAQRALAMRHAVLIYGASSDFQEAIGPQTGSAWWLLAVGGTRRYLHLPTCRMSPSPPAGQPVCCYRSFTAPNPRDPRRSRSFRWQVLLVEDPSKWTEDPLETEQRLRSERGLRDVEAKAPVRLASSESLEAVPSGASGPDTPNSSYMLFGDFDVEELFEAFDGKDPASGTDSAMDRGDAPANAATDAAIPGPSFSPRSSGDIDEFFDSLLADDIFDKAAAAARETAAAQAAIGGGSGASFEEQPASAAAVEVAPSPANAPQPSPPPPKPPQAELAPPPPAESGGGAGGSSSSTSSPAPVARASTREEGAGADAAAACSAELAAGLNGQEAPSSPPRDAVEARLRAALLRFYQRRGVSEKLGNVERIARRYAGDGIVDLWAALGIKYALPPPTAVSWLAGTLDPRTAVQWPKAAVPEGAQRALDELGLPGADSGAEGEAPAQPASGAVLAAAVAAAIRTALEAGDMDAAGALAFRHGCPNPGLRPRLWHALLEHVPGRHPASGGSTSDSTGVAKDAEDAAGIGHRRSAYRELRARMQAAVSSAEAAGGTAATGEAGAAAPPLEALRAEVEADAKSAWRGAPFLVRPNVMDAVIAVAQTHAWRCSQFVRGSCEMAALLLYVMARDGEVGLADAEADAYWYLSQLMVEVQDSIMDGCALSAQVRRVHELLRAYDPPLADLLAAHGLSAMPTLRLGTALFTRAGFQLADCVRIWDALLADPCRFGMRDYLIVALLLHSRGDLMQHQNLGSLAETLLATPRNVDVQKLLRTAYAICAFERRCADGCASPFPPRPPPSGAEVVEEAVALAQAKLSNLWDKFRTVGAEAWEVGRTVARDKVAQVAAEAPAWSAQARERVAQVAAEAPAWGAQARTAVAGAVAATRASALAAAETAASAATAALEVAAATAGSEPGGVAEGSADASEVAGAGPAAPVPVPKLHLAAPDGPEVVEFAPPPRAAKAPLLVAADATPPAAPPPPALVPAAADPEPPILVEAAPPPPALVEVPADGPPKLVEWPSAA